MTPDQSPTLAPTATRCNYCGNRVTWMATYLDGRRLCFDVQTAVRRPGAQEGWALGYFRIDGRDRMVLAPYPRLKPEERRGVAKVRTLHFCPGQHHQRVAS